VQGTFDSGEDAGRRKLDRFAGLICVPVNQVLYKTTINTSHLIKLSSSYLVSSQDRFWESIRTNTILALKPGRPTASVHPHKLHMLPGVLCGLFSPLPCNLADLCNSTVSSELALLRDSSEHDKWCMWCVHDCLKRVRDELERRR
jgi:hypothetical protein